MTTPPGEIWLQQVLRAIPRRYRLPLFPDLAAEMEKSHPSFVLANVIERARQARASAREPDAALKPVFLQTLAHLVRDALGPATSLVPEMSAHGAGRPAAGGDPAFQVLVLRYQSAQVDEYVSLSGRIKQDRRDVLAAVNAMAHPGKQQDITPGWRRDAMARLHAGAAAAAATFIESASTAEASWSALAATVRSVLAMPELKVEPSFERSVKTLLDSPALERLRRLEDLASDQRVRQYQALCDRHGPRPGSATAVAQGFTSQQRGAAVEALAAQAFRLLVRRLNQDKRALYRTVTSMRVPASLAGGASHAKTEWDVVLLRHADTVDSEPVWDVCLFAEAKASADAAVTDFPRMLRGLRLLAKADENAVYTFQTCQGEVQVCGASLRVLSTGEAALKRTVLYCCEAPSDISVDAAGGALSASGGASDMPGGPVQPPARLLNAANRMRLLSATASLDFASALAQGQDADPAILNPVWHELLESSRLYPVLHQYPVLRQVRELMVHTGDFLAAVSQ